MKNCHGGTRQVQRFLMDMMYTDVAYIVYVINNITCIPETVSCVRCDCVGMHASVYVYIHVYICIQALSSTCRTTSPIMVTLQCY